MSSKSVRVSYVHSLGAQHSLRTNSCTASVAADLVASPRSTAGVHNVHSNDESNEEINPVINQAPKFVETLKMDSPGVHENRSGLTPHSSVISSTFGRTLTKLQRVLWRLDELRVSTSDSIIVFHNRAKLRFLCCPHAVMLVPATIACVHGAKPDTCNTDSAVSESSRSPW